MLLTGYNGILFSTVNVTAHVQDTLSPGPDRSVSVIPRIGSTPYASGVSQGAQTISAVFTVKTTFQIEDTLMALLAVLNPDDPLSHTLTGTTRAGTAVQTTAYVGRWSYPNVNQLAVEFVVTTPGWRMTTYATLRPLSTATANFTIANTNTGLRPLLPVITVDWPGVVNRASATSLVGWKQKVTFVVTNIGAEPLIDQPYQIGPFDSAAWVTAGNLRSDAGDLRIFFEGLELRRNVIAPNTVRTLVWFILPDMAPGQSARIEMVINNAIAVTPPTLTISSDPPLPAMDISGDTGTLTTSTTTVGTASAAAWEVNQWAGATALNTQTTMMRRVASNTANAITYTRALNVALTVGQKLILTKSGIQGDGGKVTSATTFVITDTAQSWNVNEWIGAKLDFPAAVPAGTFTVAANTATTITMTSSMGTAPLANVEYRVYRTNGIRMWDTRKVAKATPHKGLWLTNKSQAPPSLVSFDAPGSWYRFTYQRNQDAYSQPRYDSVVVGGGYDHFPTMYLQRARRGKAGAQREVGVADAVGVASPFTILGMTHPYTIRNATKNGVAGEGLAEVRVMVQESGGELWAVAYSEVAEHNSTVTGTLGPYFDFSDLGSPNRVAMSLVPNAADEIDPADNNTAALRTNGDWVAINVDPTYAMSESIPWVTTSLTLDACYDVAMTFQTGGASPTVPYSRLTIGGDGRHVFLLSTDENIRVDCEAHLVSIQDDVGALVRRIPYAVLAEDLFADPDGVEQALVAADWLAIPPTVVSASGIYAYDSGAGWGSLSLAMTGRLGYLT